MSEPRTRQLLKRAAKVEPFALHQEVENRARGFAAKAVVALRFGKNVKRRRLGVRVEGAEAHVVPTRLAQVYVARDELDNVDTLFNCVDDC